MRCTVTSDVVFVLDDSSNVPAAGWTAMLNLMNSYVDQFQIGAGNARIGCVRYSNTASIAFGLDEYRDSASLKTAISRLQQSRRSSERNLCSAFQVTLAQLIRRPRYFAAKVGTSFTRIFASSSMHVAGNFHRRILEPCKIAFSLFLFRSKSQRKLPYFYCYQTRSLMFWDNLLVKRFSFLHLKKIGFLFHFWDTRISVLIDTKAIKLLRSLKCCLKRMWMNEMKLNEISEWMDGWLDEWMNEWMNEWYTTCTLCSEKTPTFVFLHNS